MKIEDTKPDWNARTLVGVFVVDDGDGDKPTKVEVVLQNLDADRRATVVFGGENHRNVIVRTVDANMEGHSRTASLKAVNFEDIVRWEESNE